MYKKLTVIFLMLIIVGCASSGQQILKNEDSNTIATKITKGITTQEEVRQLYGAPSQVSFTDGGLEIWTYIYAKVSSDAQNFIPIINLFAKSYSGVKKELVIVFDENHKVKNFSMNVSDIATKSGLGS